MEAYFSRSKEQCCVDRRLELHNFECLDARATLEHVPTNSLRQLWPQALIYEALRTRFHHESIVNTVAKSLLEYCLLVNDLTAGTQRLPSY